MPGETALAKVSKYDFFAILGSGSYVVGCYWLLIAAWLARNQNLSTREALKWLSGTIERHWPVLDQAVLAAYGWHQPSAAAPALTLHHDFYEVDYLPENDRTRHTIHPESRKEILKRLLQLNHKLYAEEEAQGLHKKKPGKKTKMESDEPQAQQQLI